jgi:hypothetical protein
MSTLIEFLQRQKEVNKPERQAQRQKEWLGTLNVLLQNIQTWLAEVEQKKLVRITRGSTRLTEETLGTYTAPFLTITFDKKNVKITPVGSVIIGADGRVDMESSNGTYIFLYLAEKGKWVHGFGKHPVDFPELTKELFENLLQRALA